MIIPYTILKCYNLFMSFYQINFYLFCYFYLLLLFVTFICYFYLLLLFVFINILLFLSIFILNAAFSITFIHMVVLGYVYLFAFGISFISWTSSISGQTFVTICPNAATYILAIVIS